MILLGLNEINFEFVRLYTELGHLPNFKLLIDKYGFTETVSETKYELLEPWIQWVTIHTGKTFSEHKVFRLGDIVNCTNLKQLWEYAEDVGMTAGAVSPFNAYNGLKNAAFFVPDPWTKTKFTGSNTLKGLYDAVVLAVNENAHGSLGIEALLSLCRGVASYVPLNRLPVYARLFSRLGKKATKATILDALLSDVFLALFKKHNPGFSSLFLNSGAHEQHHYMFNASVYNGHLRNPAWYISPGEDPLLDVLTEYDATIGRLLKLKSRLFIATGLHQTPHEHETFYYRLKSHQAFFDHFGVKGIDSIMPRMSRDFLINCNDEQQAKFVQDQLSAFQLNGLPLFTMDNRGQSLFVELTYDREIVDNDVVTFQDFSAPLNEFTAFVAIKNGEHDGIGYFIDTGAPKVQPGKQIPLTEVFHIIKNSFSKS